MPDSLGFRAKFGVVAPSTNTSVQPEYDDMRPRGVTNHFGRIELPNMTLTDDESFLAMMDKIRANTMACVDAVLSMSPEHLIMGMSAETFWDGAEGAARLHNALRERANGIPVTVGSAAIDVALKTYGGIHRIAIITPYMPAGDVQVHRYFEDMGYDVACVHGLKCGSPIKIAQVSAQELKRAVLEIDDASIDAVVQCGTNLAFAKVAAAAEFWLEKPVVAINTATYWHALRTSGITDKIDGYGSLLTDY